MFKLVEERRTWQPVFFHGWTEEGKKVRHRIDVQFVLLSTDAFNAFLRDARELVRGAVASAPLDEELIEDVGEEEGAEAAPAEPAPKTESQVMAEFGMRILRDWREVQEANGDPIKFGEAALARLFNVPGVFEAVLESYRVAATGKKDARAGN